MKYIVIIGDGMADFPLPELHGKTPLMAAHKPCMDMMARNGFCGNVTTIPEGFSPGSDVACMSIFGYNPAHYYTGRAPIEAHGMGITLEDGDVAFRCNLVYLETLSDKVLMGDYSGGHISTEEARILIHDINNTFGNGEFAFFPGVSYRHIMVWHGGSAEMTSTPPHDITDQDIARYLPQGNGADILIALMDRVHLFLKEHPVNRQREGSGKRPANSIWLWGQGKRAHLPAFESRFGLRGATVAAVDLVKGISHLIGFDTPLVQGATGYLDTDYGAKARTALELMEHHDIVYIHIEAPDEASHNGSVEEKIRAIERIDSEVVDVLFKETGDDTRFLITTDHATPITMKTHYACPVPFVIFQKNETWEGCASGYHEHAGEKVFTGEELIERFIQEYRP